MTKTGGAKNKTSAVNDNPTPINVIVERHLYGYKYCDHMYHYCRDLLLSSTNSSKDIKTKTGLRLILKLPNDKMDKLLKLMDILVAVLAIAVGNKKHTGSVEKGEWIEHDMERNIWVAQEGTMYEYTGVNLKNYVSDTVVASLLMGAARLARVLVSKDVEFLLKMHWEACEVIKGHDRQAAFKFINKVMVALQEQFKTSKSALVLLTESDIAAIKSLYENKKIVLSDAERQRYRYSPILGYTWYRQNYRRAE